MKLLVDKMPDFCSECMFAVDVIIPTQLGVPKQAKVCVFKTSLIPPKSQDEEPDFINEFTVPYDIDCPLTDGKDKITKETKSNKSNNEKAIKSSILLS